MRNSVKKNPVFEHICNIIARFWPVFWNDCSYCMTTLNSKPLRFPLNFRPTEWFQCLPLLLRSPKLNLSEYLHSWSSKTNLYINHFVTVFLIQGATVKKLKNIFETDPYREIIRGPYGNSHGIKWLFYWIKYLFTTIYRLFCKL